MTGAKTKPKNAQWQCDNCGYWNDDDGTGNDEEGYTCAVCDAVMYPDEGQEMTWRESPYKEYVCDHAPCKELGQRMCRMTAKEPPTICMLEDGLIQERVPVKWREA